MKYKKDTKDTIQKHIKVYCPICKNQQYIRVKNTSDEYILSCGHYVKVNIVGAQWSAGK